MPWTKFQIFVLIVSIMFGMAGWASWGYVYGYLKGGEDAHKQIIKDYKEGIELRKIP